MAKITVTIKGTDKVLQNAMNALERWQKALRSATYLIGNNIMKISKERVPWDTGTLAGSGYVILPERRGSAIITELGYGGPAKKYAVIQHENLKYFHPNGRQAKYLSSVINEFEGNLKQDISKLAKAAFEKRGDATLNPSMPEHPDKTGPLGYKKTGGKRPRRRG